MGKTQDPKWLHSGKQPAGHHQHEGPALEPQLLPPIQPHILSLTYEHYSKQLS